MSAHTDYACRQRRSLKMISGLFPDRTSSSDVDWVYQIVHDVDHYSGPSMVYFIQAVSVNLIKIGRSINPERRLVQLRLLSPVDLKIIGAVPGGPAEECLIHSGLDFLRSHGEWFHGTPMLMKFIEALCSDRSAE